MADVDTLDVLLHGERIGTLTRVPGDRNLFAFTEDYRADRDRPVLSLSFKDRFGELVTDFRPTQTRLLPFFSNLLPEGHLRAYLAARAEVKPVREFFLIQVLGLDLPGAVSVRSPRGDAWPAGQEGDTQDERPDSEKALRFSLAGVQLKFSAAYEAGFGLTIPVGGVGGSHIVKLPSAQFPGVPENEFSMMTLAGAVGIDVPDVSLIDVDAIANLPREMSDLPGQALLVKRFDRRPDGTAVHIEDFAQVFGVYPEEKYEKASYRNIASVIAAESGQAALIEFIRRLVFNVLIGNADMHLKNWSMIYPDGRKALLAPAYDLVATIAYIPDRNAALNFSRTKRFDEFTEDELLHLASRARLPEKAVIATARETVARFHEHWGREKGHLPLARSAASAIDAHLSTVPVA